MTIIFVQIAFRKIYNDLAVAEIILWHEGIGEGDENRFAVAINGYLKQIACAVVWHADKLAQFAAILQDHIKTYQIVGVGFVGFEFWKFLSGNKKFNAFQRLRFVTVIHALKTSNKIILRRFEFCDFELSAGG